MAERQFAEGVPVTHQDGAEPGRRPQGLLLLSQHLLLLSFPTTVREPVLSATAASACSTTVGQVTSETRVQGGDTTRQPASTGFAQDTDLSGETQDSSRQTGRPVIPTTSKDASGGPSPLPPWLLLPAPKAPHGYGR